MTEIASPGFPLDVEELDIELHDADPVVDETPETGDESHPGATGRPSRSNRAHTNRLVRRVAAKAADVVAAEQSTRDVASHLLGCDNDLADLTAAIMTADRSSTQVLGDLDKISTSDVFEASVVAGELGPQRMKRIWSLLASMGLAPSSDLPASSAKASIVVAKTVHGLNMADLRKDLEDVVTLLKKA